MNKISKIFFFSPFFWLQLLAQPAIPCGHSHNDYLQQRPLYTAVEFGYASIEIDVCLDKTNKIKVAHNPWLLSGKKTIEEMYLDPIVRMIKENDTLFKYSEEHPLILMIDIKTNRDSTYKYLKLVLSKYEKYITRYCYKNDSIVQAPLKICLSGKAPDLAIIKEDWQMVKIDVGFGPANELYHDYLYWSPSVYPADILFIIERRSDPYFKLLKYRGMGDPDQRDVQTLKIYAESTHSRNKQLRFYAAPKNKKVWRYLLDAGVDWINVDKLKKFAGFYKNYLKEKNHH